MALLALARPRASPAPTAPRPPRLAAVPRPLSKPPKLLPVPPICAPSAVLIPFLMSVRPAEE